MATLVGTVVNNKNAGSEGKIEGTFGFGTYATGGDTFVPASVGATLIKRVLVAPYYDSTLGLLNFQYDYANNKLKAYNVLGGGFSGTLERVIQSSAAKTIRIYVGTVVGTPAAGNVVTGGTSSETATVAEYDAAGGYITVTSPSGAFTSGENLAFSVSGATAVMLGNLVDSWAFAPAVEEDGAITFVGDSTTGVGLVRAPTILSVAKKTIALPTGQYRFVSAVQSVETLSSDAVASIDLEYTSGVVSISGTGFREVTNGTDMSALTAVPFEVYWG